MNRERIIELWNKSADECTGESHPVFLDRFAALIEAETIERCEAALNSVMVTDHSMNTFKRCQKAIRSLK